MTPRPRKASDEEIIAATLRVMSRLGPAEVTLADIAAEAGLTAGALVQRFGSKRELLLTVMERFAGGTAEMFVGLRTSHASPLETLFVYADCMAAMGESPAALAHHLAYLQLDLTDPDFHRLARQQAVESREEIRKLIEEAIGAGELAPSLEAAELARVVELTVSGSLMTWAFYQEGAATAWIRADLERVLRACGALE